MCDIVLFPEIICHVPMDENAAPFTNSEVQFNETTLYICNEGYRFENGRAAVNITCNELGYWNNIYSECKSM